MDKYINLVEENLDTENICCIVRVNSVHSGISSKRNWLSNRFRDGLVFRKLKNASAPVFIEYSPLEHAYVPIVADNYMYIYCLWVTGPYKNHGHGRALLEYAINDAKQKGKSGICILGAEKQKSWLTDQSFAKHFGFKVVDSTPTGYQLLALSFDGTVPQFSPTAKVGKIENKAMTVYYTYQCPYICQEIHTIERYCRINNVELEFILVDSVEKAKNLPCPFNNFALFYKGKLQTTNMPDERALNRMVKK